MRASERPRNIVCVVGTRPEAIKTAPIVLALRREPWARCRLVFTAQHRDLASSIFDFFDVRPDVDLDVMRPGQSLADLSNRLLVALHETLLLEEPDCVVAQGDTSTVLAAAIASYMLGVPFAHVEAGLRTHRLDAPFPEEANRVAAGHLASLHFAPTPAARENLLREGIAAADVHLTGNTGIDALRIAAEREVPLENGPSPGAPFALVTVHRRENLGEPLRRICEGIRLLHDRRPGLEFLWPLHPNPGVEPVVRELLGGLDRVRLVRPLDYGPFVTALKRAALILSDSGGVQEEAAALRTPILVLRGVSEREEAVAHGVATLVGDDPAAIVREGTRYLANPQKTARTFRDDSPFGDGRATERIVAALRTRLLAARPEPAPEPVAV